MLFRSGLIDASASITSVTGEPRIEVVPTAIDFGTSFFDSSTGSLFGTAQATVRVENTGTAALNLSDVSFTGSAFGFATGSEITATSLAIGEAVTGVVEFAPSATGTFSETLTFTSDASNAATVDVTLDGVAELPPVAGVSNEKLFEAVTPGQTATQTITVENTGDADLTYDIFAEALGLGPFNPGDVAAPASANRASAMATELEALPAPPTGPTLNNAFNPADFIYTLDDGIPENSIGLSSGADLVWLNAFQAQEGATTITAIASAFGSSVSAGDAAEFLLYNDPDDDGNPDDATLLARVSTQREASGNDLQVEPVTPTTVSGVFFVGVFVPSTTFAAPLDETDSQGASWFGFTPPGSLNPTSLPSMSQIGDLGLPGDWVTRAQGSYVAFEPVSGTIPSGSAEDVDITFDGTSLSVDTYDGNAAVSSNDPVNPQIDVPFDFFVADAVGEVTIPTGDGTYPLGDTGLSFVATDVLSEGRFEGVRIDEAASALDGIPEADTPSSYRWIIFAEASPAINGSLRSRFDRADIPNPGFDAANGPTIDVHQRQGYGTGTFDKLSTTYDDGGTPNDLSDDFILGTIPTSGGKRSASSTDIQFSEFVFASDTAPLPVEFASFDVTADAQDAVLSWQTASETNNAGFRIEYQTAEATSWTDAGTFIEGAGTTTEPQSYRYRLADLSPDTYRFRLRQVDVDGTASVSAERQVAVRMDEAFALSPVRPNPVAGYGELSLSVRDAQSVQVALYNVLGQRVTTLLDETLDPQSTKRLSVDTRTLSSGIYFVRVVGESFQTTRKITVVR